MVISGGSLGDASKRSVVASPLTIGEAETGGLEDGGVAFSRDVGLFLFFVYEEKMEGGERTLKE